MSASTATPELNVTSDGAPKASLVLLHHGFAGSARNWRPQMRALREGYRAVAYDARGHARTAAKAPDISVSYSLDDFVADFQRVADAQLQAAPAGFVAGGLSLGAAVALHAALARPDRVRGLVLAAFPSGRDGDGGFAPAAEAFAESLERDGVEAAGERFVWGAQSGLDAEAARLVRLGFVEHPPRALAAILRECIARLPSVEELAPKLAGLDVPTLVIVGGEDRPSLPGSRRLAESLPDARLVEIPGAGHVVNLAAREAFDAALLEFLNELRP